MATSTISNAHIQDLLGSLDAYNRFVDWYRQTEGGTPEALFRLDNTMVLYFLYTAYCAYAGLDPQTGRIKPNLTVYYPSPINGGTIEVSPGVPPDGFPTNTQLIIKAVPNEGWKFAYWTGNLSLLSSSIVQWNLTSSISFSAVFAAIPVPTPPGPTPTPAGPTPTPGPPSAAAGEGVAVAAVLIATWLGASKRRL